MMFPTHRFAINESPTQMILGYYFVFLNLTRSAHVNYISTRLCKTIYLFCQLSFKTMVIHRFALIIPGSCNVCNINMKRFFSYETLIRIPEKSTENWIWSRLSWMYLFVKEFKNCLDEYTFRTAQFTQQQNAEYWVPTPKKKKKKSAVNYYNPNFYDKLLKKHCQKKSC